jgi:hypothetical protein
MTTRNSTKEHETAAATAGIVRHVRSACQSYVLQAELTGFQQSKRLTGRLHHTRQFCLSVFNCAGRTEGQTVCVWGALDKEYLLIYDADRNGRAG